MAESFEELAHGSTAHYGACAGIWVMIVYASPSKADMLLARSALAAMAKQTAHPFPTLTWCLAEAGYQMEADARTAASGVTREFAANISAQATLIEGQGFQAAAVRAIIGGLDAMSRTASKKKVFAELAPTVRWCLEVRAGGLAQADARRVAELIEDARKKLARPRLLTTNLAEMSARPSLASPPDCHGSYAEGFAPIAEAFAAHFRPEEPSETREIGASLAVYHRGRCVVDLWGGQADVANQTPWLRDSRIVVFSVSKGLTAMAFALAGDRGLFDWDAPVARYWPGFAQAGKAAITVRTLLNHRAGLCALDVPLTIADCIDEARRPVLVDALERQAPLWEPGSDQGYHAVSFGLYAGELFARVAGESIGTFLSRELFVPLDADVSLGTPRGVDGKIATLYPPSKPARILKMLASTAVGANAEERVLKATLSRGSLTRRAFFNPSGAEPQAWNELPIRRAELPAGSATASAQGIARAYLPFALGGAFEGRRFLREESLRPVYERQGWSACDRLLQKALGWSQGFLKEESTIFSPTRASFGHAGIGGSLGWCDPERHLTIGYAMNRLDWRVRSPRALALCRALYECEPVRAAGATPSLSSYEQA